MMRFMAHQANTAKAIIRKNIDNPPLDVSAVAIKKNSSPETVFPITTPKTIVSRVMGFCLVGLGLLTSGDWTEYQR